MAISTRYPACRKLTVFLPCLFFLALGLNISAQSMTSETFAVNLVPSENGSYTISPKIPDDGQVDAGTELTVKATPAYGYELDAIYYTVKGGMWGTTGYENFSSPMKITVDKDMAGGATFVKNL